MLPPSGSWRPGQTATSASTPLLSSPQGGGFPLTAPQTAAPLLTGSGLRGAPPYGQSSLPQLPPAGGLQGLPPVADVQGRLQQGSGGLQGPPPYPGNAPQMSMPPTLPAMGMQQSAGQYPTMGPQTMPLSQTIAPQNLPPLGSQGFQGPSQFPQVQSQNAQGLSQIAQGVQGLAQNAQSLTQISQPQQAAGQIMVTIVSALGLKKADWFGKSDPYCVCDVGPLGNSVKPHSQFKTATVKKTQEPVWKNQEHIFTTFNVGDALHFSVWDKDQAKSDDCLGRNSVAYDQFYPNGFNGLLKLADAGKDNATLTVKIAVLPLGETTWRPLPAMQSVPLVGSALPAADAGAGPPTLPLAGSQAMPASGPPTLPASGLHTSTSTIPTSGPPTLAGYGPQNFQQSQGLAATAMFNSTAPASSINSAGGFATGNTMASDLAMSARLGSSLPNALGSSQTPPPSRQKERNAIQAVNRWMRHWICKREVLSDPMKFKDMGVLQRGQSSSDDRMFVFRVKSAFDLLVPLTGGDRVPKNKWSQAQKDAETYAMTALSVRLRFSFVDSPGGLAPSLFGHTMLSPKLTVQKAEVVDSADKTSMSKLKVSVLCNPQPIIFFRGGAHPDKQLLVELVAEMEPQLVAFPQQTGYTLAQGEGIRVRADGWRGNIGGGVAFTVDIRKQSGGIALRWAPAVDGEHVFRNSLILDPRQGGGTWGPQEIGGGWPHLSTAPDWTRADAQGGPFVLDFRYAADHWQVWVDGDRQPDFDFAFRQPDLDISSVECSANLINAQAFIIPRDQGILGQRTMQRGASSAPAVNVVPRLWRVDHAITATVKPKRASMPPLRYDAKELYGKEEPVIFGWTCIRFDNATESRRQHSSAFRLGSLHDWLLPEVDRTGDLKPKPTKAGLCSKPLGSDVHDFLLRVDKQQVGTIEYELERVQIEPAPRRLLPPDFPAWKGLARLGGISSWEIPPNRLVLRAADQCDCYLRDICVHFPDDQWLDEFRRSVDFVDPAARGDHVRKLQQLYLRVGSHNSLRWLDDTIKNRMEAVMDGRTGPPPSGMSPDETGHTWNLDLQQETQGQMRKWVFRGGEVPLEFACDVDCALVIELVAVVMSSKNGAVQSAAAAPHLHTQTISWTLLLPLEHTSEEALRQARDAALQPRGASPVVYYNMELQHQDDTITGKKVFRWKQPAHNSASVSFGVEGDTYLRWLQRKRTPIEIPEELKPKPMTQPASGMLGSAPLLPQIAQQQQDAATSLLLQGLAPQADVAQFQQLGQAVIPAAYQQQPVSVQQGQDAATQALLQTAGTGVFQPQPPWVQQGQDAATKALLVPSPELQTVVERIYLRDQGTQSEPPPLPGLEDHIIGDGRALSAAAVGALTGQPSSPPRPGQPYVGPAMRPLPGGSAARLMLDLGDAGAQRILQGLPHTKTPGPRREMRWRLEDDDPLQADEVTVEFLAFRSFAGASSERVHFQLRFFVFPPIKTASAVLAGGPGEACMLRSAVTNERLALLYHVDGATKGAASTVHRQLAEYMSARSAEVEVWHSDSVMQIGSVTVPLESLVRQGHQVTKTEGEFPVLDPMTGETRGCVQVLMSCRGRTPTRPGAPGALPTVPALPGALNTSVLSEAPSVLNASASVFPGADVTAVKPTERERGRVRHKAQALLGANNGTSAMVSMVDLPDDAEKKRQRLKQLRIIRGTDVSERFADHTALLSAAEEVRVDRKRAEVARRMDRFNTSQLTVFAPFAHSSFFSVEFANPYNQQVAFIITISEPQRAGVFPGGAAGVPGVVATAGAIGVPGAGPPRPTTTNFQNILQVPPDEALALVKDPAEWQRLVAERKVPQPPSGELTLFNALGHFTLRPGETTFLPFRYLAFSHPSLSAVAQQAAVGGMALQDAEAASTEVPDRTFVIEVLVHQGPPLKRVEVTARAQPCVVDRTVRFFEVEGTPIEKTLALPARAPLSGILHGAGQRNTDVGEYSAAGGMQVQMERRADRFIYCTDTEVHLQWKDEDSLQVRLLAPMSPSVRRFFVLCYADPHFMRVVAAQLVEVHAMKHEHVRVTVGHSVDRTISLPPVELLETALVQAYSSDPQLLSVKRAASVDPRYGAKIEITICATRAGTRTCRLHCTDPTTHRRVAAFLVVIAAEMPEVRMAHDITLQLNMTVRKHLRYKNETMRPLRYTLKSSDPAICTVQTPELFLPPSDTRVVELLFHAQPATMSYTAEVYLFIASEDRAIQETRLLQLSYT